MVIHADASLQGAGLSWGGYRRAQWATMTKRRRRRLNRCRPSNALDAHRKDPGDDEGGAQQVGAQNNNQHCRYVSFSRRRGIHRVQLESQPMLTQRRPEAVDKQATEKPKDANPNAADARSEQCQPAAARRLKVAWRSRATGAHPLSPFMRIEAYRMFDVRAVPGVRLHLLDSDSSLFLTPFKDALILGIRTVMNIWGVGGDVSKVKSPLVYTFLDSKGEYVGFHYQALYLLESLPIPLFATGPAEQQMWSFLLGPRWALDAVSA